MTVLVEFWKFFTLLANRKDIGCAGLNHMEQGCLIALFFLCFIVGAGVSRGHGYSRKKINKIWGGVIVKRYWPASAKNPLEK